ncbi:MAG: hypothetical protein CVU98_02405 [Firmicutes bacterium HGW-Firmicutes-3]|nr:MAG: hypothetical protein CVU98_02405 [Firmicutes bacterium HGW-Firmicutes-3]
MTENIKVYETYLEEKLNQNTLNHQDLSNHRAQIAYLQHERYIHLLVTCVVSIILFLTFMLCLFQDSLLLYLLLIILIILDFFYVRHYYVLENTIQHWYRVETEIIEKVQNVE